MAKLSKQFDAFKVGDTIHTPMRGPVVVDTIGKRWFTGHTPEGERFGETGIHIPDGEYTGQPWKIDPA